MILEGWTMTHDGSGGYSRLQLEINLEDGDEGELIVRALNKGRFLEDFIERYAKEQQDKAIEELVEIANG